MNSTDPGHEPDPLDDLPAYCSAEFLVSHMATERREGMFLPMMFGRQVDDEDAARINRAYDHLRAQGHGKTDTVDELTERTFPLTARTSS